ncbi:hypothetical protein JOF29_002567 [Kribbella aluminosa]|uniref:Aminoglycoside phosphotransferase domain-containing protein n=1 Tax=Kribbella aluminosa TaxID=416017 RepID=A0ABS4UIP9_9ACTN|nr:phosphotransferase [Kribbella aluminosa]MBP2351484.1 hypothetical protein [Kribbella aluminosa]
MRWLDEYSPAAIADLVRQVTPELSDLPIVTRELVNKDEPVWWSSSAVVGGRYVAKFAWSRPAALRLAHEVAVLDALSREPAVPYLPKVVASSTDPLLLVTELVPGTSLFEVVDAIDRNQAGRQLAHFGTAGRAEPEYDLRAFPGTGPADHRTPPDWIDDLAARFTALNL